MMMPHDSHSKFGWGARSTRPNSNANRRAKEWAVTQATAAPPGGAAATVHKTVVGIQVGGISFLDEGTEQVLDVLQERGAAVAGYLWARLRAWSSTMFWMRGLAALTASSRPVFWASTSLQDGSITSCATFCHCG